MSDSGKDGRGAGPSDEALMIAYQGGDGQAFEALFARYAPVLLGLFLRQIRARAQAVESYAARRSRRRASRSAGINRLPGVQPENRPLCQGTRRQGAVLHQPASLGLANSQGGKDETRDR